MIDSYAGMYRYITQRKLSPLIDKKMFVRTILMIISYIMIVMRYEQYSYIQRLRVCNMDASFSYIIPNQPILSDNERISFDDIDSYVVPMSGLYHLYARVDMSVQRPGANWYQLVFKRQNPFNMIFNLAGSTPATVGELDLNIEANLKAGEKVLLYIQRSFGTVPVYFTLNGTIRGDLLIPSPNQ